MKLTGADRASFGCCFRRIPPLLSRGGWSELKLVNKSLDYGAVCGGPTCHNGPSSPARLGVGWASMGAIGENVQRDFYGGPRGRVSVYVALNQGDGLFRQG